MLIKKSFVKDGRLRSRSYQRFNRSPSYESLYTKDYKRKFLVECYETYDPEPKATTITQLRVNYG